MPKYFYLMNYGLIAGMALLAVSCSQRTDENHAMSPAPVTVAVAVQKDVPVEMRSIGNVEAYSTVSVKTQVEGTLSRVCFKEGQEVQKGDLLFTIDPRPFQAMLRQAEANLAKDTAQMKKAGVDSRRYEDLLRDGVVSRQEYDQHRADYESLRAMVQADEAAAANARLQLGYCRIRSPIRGRIGNLAVNQGNVVKANDTILVTINQTKPIYTTFFLPEHALPEIRKYTDTGSLKVEAIIPGNEEHPVIGEVAFINNEVNTTTGTVLCKAVFANEDEFLWPKQFVQVAVTLTTMRNALVAPTQAIQTGQNNRYVFVVKPDLTVELRPVVPGNTYNQETVITSGLQPGERVVTDGHLRLAPGVKVEIKNEPETPARN